IKEREVLQGQLALTNDALAAQREAPTRQQTSVPAPAVPHTQAEHRVPIITAREELEEANEPADGTQQAHGVVAHAAHGELARDELAPVHSTASSSETVASGANWFANWLMSRLARGGQASRSWFRWLDEQGRSRRAGDHPGRRRSSAMWGFLKLRLGATVDQHRRVSPTSHPK